MRKYDYVLFDLDGTLTDPAEGITNSIAYALKKMNIPVPPKESLYKFIGPPLLDSFTEHFGMSLEEARRGVTYYREYFDAGGLFENAPLPGALKALAALKRAGCVNLLATSKPEGAAKRIVERYGMAEYLDFVCGADLEGVRTAKDIVIRYALDAAGITDPKTAVMVGDRSYDVMGAKKNGLDCIGVTFGFGSREELDGAVFIADAFDEVGDFII